MTRRLLRCLACFEPWVGEFDERCEHCRAKDRPVDPHFRDVQPPSEVPRYTVYFLGPDGPFNIHGAISLDDAMQKARRLGLVSNIGEEIV